MNIYLTLGHPDKESFNGKIADAYEQAALSKGHEVRRQNIGDLNFDPILRKGYTVIQELEPGLQEAQQNILWCNKWVIIYPVWWGSLPAVLKGFLDRTLLPGFAFKYHEKAPFWDKLLKGRSAEIITTSDAPALWLWFAYRNSDINTIRNAVLKFCGFSPVTYKRIGGMRNKNRKQLEEALQSLMR